MDRCQKINKGKDRDRSFSKRRELTDEMRRWNEGRNEKDIRQDCVHLPISHRDVNTMYNRCIIIFKRNGFKFTGSKKEKFLVFHYAMTDNVVVFNIENT